MLMPSPRRHQLFLASVLSESQIYLRMCRTHYAKVASDHGHLEKSEHQWIECI
jgi:hypothetical protein